MKIWYIFIIFFLNHKLLSRAKPALGSSVGSNTGSGSGQKQSTPELKDFLTNRDYTGAIALLEVKLNSML